MVSFNEVQAQLVGLNNHFRFIGIAELKQLALALQPGEKILDCVKGWHAGNVAVMCSTDARIFIVNKMSGSKNVLQIPYTSVKAVEIIDSGWKSRVIVQLHAEGEAHEFMSWHMKRLRQLHQFVERHLVYIREQSNELLSEALFETSIQPKNTSRNWAVFAKRIGSSSLS